MEALLPRTGAVDASPNWNRRDTWLPTGCDREPRVRRMTATESARTIVLGPEA